MAEFSLLKKLKISGLSVDKEDTEAYAKAIKRLEKSRYYEEVWEFGKLVAQSGKGPQDSTVTLMTGEVIIITSHCK